MTYGPSGMKLGSIAARLPLFTCLLSVIRKSLIGRFRDAIDSDEDRGPRTTIVKIECDRKYQLTATHFLLIPGRIEKSSLGVILNSQQGCACVPLLHLRSHDVGRIRINSTSHSLSAPRLCTTKFAVLQICLIKSLT